MTTTRTTMVHLSTMFAIALLASGLTALVFRSREKGQDSTLPNKEYTETKESANALASPQYMIQIVPPSNSTSPVDPQPRTTQSPQERGNAASLDEERAAIIASAFAKDTAGNHESRTVENRFRNALMDPKLEGVRLIRLECRARSCRADMDFSGREADDRAIIRLIRETDDNGYSIIVPQRHYKTDGSITVSAYLFASGATPEMPAPVEFAQSAGVP